jgi:hypothetical protein
MKLWRFEGSPEEFSAVASALMSDGEVVVKADVAKPIELVEKKNGRQYVTVEGAKEILTRRELSDSMKNVLRLLHKAGDQRLLSEELMKVNKHSGDQFRGLMGAFGRRTVNTVGGATWFFDDEWNHALSQNTYRLPPTVRQALDELDIL